MWWSLLNHGRVRNIRLLGHRRVRLHVRVHAHARVPAKGKEGIREREFKKVYLCILWLWNWKFS